MDIHPVVLLSPPTPLPHRSYGNYIQNSRKLNQTTDEEVSLPARKLIVRLNLFYTCSASSRSVHIFTFNVRPEELDAAHTLLDKCEGRLAMRLDLGFHSYKDSF